MINRLICMFILCNLLMLSTFSDTQKKMLSFSEFKEKYNKKYATKQQQSYRHGIYQQHIKKINQNQQYQTLGVGPFSDMTSQQRKSSLFGLQLPKNYDKIKMQHSNQVKVSLSISAIKFPAQFDWRDKKMVSKVRNQGTCGSCWAFSTTAAVESLLIQEGSADAQTLDLAEQQLLQCTEDSSCSGGNPSFAAQYILQANGMYNQSNYPYRPLEYYNGEICSLNTKKGYIISGRTKNYYGVSDQQLISYLQISPLIVMISADSLSTQYDTTPAIHKCTLSDSQINHAVLLVGYTQQYWIIKNSWGTKWGFDGFGFISRTRANNANCLIHTWLVGIWRQCKVPNCSKCQEYGKCTICSRGYFKTTDGKACRPCYDNHCERCYNKDENSAMQGRCKICNPNYTLISSNQTCVAVSQSSISNCLIHSSDLKLCLTCNQNFIISKDHRRCISCRSHCISCLASNPQKCLSCLSGYQGQNCTLQCSSKCLIPCQTPGKCSKCMDGYTGDNCQVMECKGNCEKCSQPNVCDLCFEGYQLPDCLVKQTQFIVSCDSNILNCDGGCNKQSFICDKCNDHFYGPQCNLQVTCDAQKCVTKLTTLKPIAKVSSSTGNLVGTTGNLSNPIQNSSLSGWIIALIVVSCLLVLTLGTLILLVYKLRTTKIVQSSQNIQMVQNDGSNKSIPYVGKRISV